MTTSNYSVICFFKEMLQTVLKMMTVKLFSFINDPLDAVSKYFMTDRNAEIDWWTEWFDFKVSTHDQYFRLSPISS